MRHILVIMVAMLSVGMVGCQKASDTTRIGASGPRAGGATNGSIPNNLVLNGVVRADQSYQSQFQQAVKDFMEAQIDPEFVGYVSAQSADQTGVFVAGRVELANGQPLQVNQLQGGAQYDILPTSDIFVAVYDKFSNQSNLPQLPATWLRQASGYIRGNQVFITFSDQYGSITLEGQIQNPNSTLRFTFDTKRTYNGHVGYRGVMGDLTIPTCQFFRCQ